MLLLRPVMQSVSDYRMLTIKNRFVNMTMLLSKLEGTTDWVDLAKFGV